jgi:hypothetical protein
LTQITFELQGSNLDKKDVFSESDPYFTISRCNPDGSDTVVYRSEWIKVSRNLSYFLMRIYYRANFQDNANPEWKKAEITSGKLCNGDWNRKLKFEIFDHDTGSDDYIGQFETNLEEVSKHDNLSS